MKLGKVKPTATVVAQFPAGLEVEAIMHEGKVFMPVMTMGDFGVAETGATASVTKTVKKSAPAPEPEEVEDTASETVSSYTEEELMAKTVKELAKILKDEFDIDPADYPGKNTNKKLRELILDALDGAEDVSDEDDVEDDVEEEAPTPKKSKTKKDSDDEDTDDVSEGLLDETIKLLEDFDSGALNKKKTIAKLVGLGEDADEDAIAGIIDNFESDDKLEIDEVAEQLVSVIETEEKPKAKTAKKATAKKSKKTEELVDVDDLEEGDKVSVYWDGEDFDEWYEGEVKSIKKSRKGLVVTIAYDDDTEDVIDAEIHTKIKRLD